MFLEIENLIVRYGKSEALKGIDISLKEGDLITLLGANGAGKTTILRAISGLIEIASGEIWFEGKRIDGLKSHEITKTGISHVLANRRIIAPMTVLENLEIGAYLRKSNSEVLDALENVYTHFPALRERKKQKAGSLSGGEQQMLAVARALMNKPKLLLLDEPSIGLSPLLVQEVGRIIKQINHEGIGIILVEQNAFLGLELAERAYILETGNCVLEGNAKELIDDHRVKAAYMGSV
jgi:branched-chain amino acid transport system ATP-binding protein